MLCQLKRCNRCQGDLVLDGDEWRCWQCGRYYYPRAVALEPPPDGPDEETAETMTEGMPTSTRRHRRPRWAAGDINPLIVAEHRSEERWWERNRDLIRYLDEGRSVREISVLVDLGERQIRVIRDQLKELRAAQEQG